MYSSHVDTSCSITTSAPEFAISRTCPEGSPDPNLMFHVMTRSEPPDALLSEATGAFCAGAEGACSTGTGAGASCTGGAGSLQAGAGACAGAATEAPRPGTGMPGGSQPPLKQ